MRLKVAGLLVLCAAATASANPRETIQFSNVDSDGNYMDATNVVLTQTVTGGYSVGRVRFSGTLNAVNPGTYESESVFEVIPPSGPSFFIQPSFVDDTYTSTTFTDIELILDEAITDAAGTWTIRFFETYNDSDVDANWSNWQLVLDDGPAATDRFVESADAGSLPGTATVVDTRTGPLAMIRAEIANDEDLFKIQICDPASFSASTMFGTALDTRLYLFDANGMGVVGNDDVEIGLDYYYQSEITAPPGLAPGEYYLAVTIYNHMPVDSAGQALWLTTPYETIRTPDGPGAASPIAGWTATVNDEGFYDVYLTGACFVGQTGPTCGTADFDGDGDFGTDADIESFFACLSGNCCATCWHLGADFNADGDAGTDSDIEAFFRVLAGGHC